MMKGLPSLKLHCITIYDICKIKMMDDLPSYSIFYNDHCLKVIQKSCKPNVHFETSQGTKTFAMVFVKMKEAY